MVTRLTFFIPLSIILGMAGCNRTRVEPSIDSQSSYDRSLFLRNIDLLINYEEKVLKDYYIFDYKGDSTQLSVLFNNGTRLVMFFSHSACMNCVNNLFNLINSYISEANKSSMVFLTDTKDSRVMIAFMKRYGIDETLYKIQLDKDIDIVYHPGPLLFLLDNSLKIGKIMETSLLEDSIIRDYFQAIFMKHQSDISENTNI